MLVASNSDSSEWISIKLSIGSEQGKLFDFGLILAKHRSNLLNARPCTDIDTLVYSACALDTATGRTSNLWPARCDHMCAQELQNREVSYVCKRRVL